MFADIIVYLKIPVGVLTYRISSDIANDIKFGQIVQVDFRGKKAFGLVVDFRKNAQDLSYKIKNIIKIIDSTPLSNTYIDLIKWVSEYYTSSLSESLTSAVPSPPSKLKDVINSTNMTVASGEKKSFLVIGDKLSRWKNYIKIIEKAIASNTQTLICLPQIEDVNKFCELIPKKISFTKYYSGLTKLKKYKIYQESKTNTYNVICGVRNTVFLPLPNLKMIIIDEEEAISHHSDQKPYLSTSKIAEWLAKSRNLNLVYGNVVPSVKQWGKLKKKKINLITNRNFLFSLEKIKLKLFSTSKGSFINPSIFDEINKTKGEVFLFVPRQYYSQFVKCSDCENIIRCKKCQRVLNAINHFLSCQNCGFEMAMPENCPACNGTNLKIVGVKSENIYNELFKNISINKEKVTVGGLVELDAIQDKKFELVAVVGLDILLGILAYNQEEKVISTLFKLASVTKESLIIQTNKMENKIMQTFSQKNIINFLDEALEIRRKHNLPPFGIAAEVSSRGKTADESLNIMNKFVNSAEKFGGIEILGPYEKLDFRKDSMHYFQIFIKFNTEKQKTHLIKNLNKDLFFQIHE